MRIIGLYGRKGVGKDFVADCFESAIKQYGGYESFPKVAKGAFADPIKEFLVNNLGVDRARIYGNDQDKVTPTEYRWEQMPDFVMRTNQGKQGQMTIRDLMQVFGTELCRNIWDKQIWVKAMRRRMLATSADYFIITDVRFPNEVGAIKEWGGRAWLVRGPQRVAQKARTDGHESEKLLLGEDAFDFVVSNEFEGSVADAQAGIRFQIAKGLGLAKPKG